MDGQRREPRYRSFLAVGVSNYDTVPVLVLRSIYRETEDDGVFDFRHLEIESVYARKGR